MISKSVICSFSVAKYIFSGGFILQGKAITKNMDIFLGSFTSQFYATNFCFRLKGQNPHFFRATDCINLMS